MKFSELKQVINRNEGRHDKVSVSIGLGWDATISAASPILDALDRYEVDYICPSTVGRNEVTDEQEPCIKIVLKEISNNGSK